MVLPGFLTEISVKDHCVDLRVGFGEERKSWSTVMAGVSSRCETFGSWQMARAASKITCLRFSGFGFSVPGFGLSASGFGLSVSGSCESADDLENNLFVSRV